MISQWLGHAQLDTTLIYAHADTEQKRKAIEQATPSDSPLKNHLNAEKYQVTDDDAPKTFVWIEIKTIKKLSEDSKSMFP